MGFKNTRAKIEQEAPKPTPMVKPPPVVLDDATGEKRAKERAALEVRLRGRSSLFRPFIPQPKSGLSIPK